MNASEYTIFLTIGGLVLLLLLLISFAQKYQAYQMQKEITLRRMLRSVRAIEDNLDKVRGAAIPHELSVALRKEILARYMAMRQIHKNIQDIGADLDQAQRQLSAAEAAGRTVRQAVSDRVVLNNYVIGISGLIGYLYENNRIAAIGKTEKEQFINQLADLRIDYLEDFHSREGRGLARQELWADAMAHYKELLHALHALTPITRHTNELIERTNIAYKQVSLHQVPDDPG